MTFDGTVAPGLFESGGESGLVTAQMFGEVSEWGGGGSEAHAVAALAGGLSQSQGKVRFPCAAVAQQQYVLAAGEELTSGQVDLRDPP